MKIVVLAKHVPDATGERTFALTARSTGLRATDCCRNSTSTPSNRRYKLPMTGTTSMSLS